MKTDKSLINEIYRLQQLMGKPLLVEGIVKIADDVVNFITKIAPRLSDETLRLTKKLQTATNDDDILKILSQISNTNDEVASVIIPRIMSTLSDKETAEIAKLKLFFKTNIKNGTIKTEAAKKMVDTWIQKSVKTPFNGVKDILKKELNDFIEIELKKVNVPEPRPVIKPKNITDVAGQKWDEIKPIEPSELKKLENLYRQKGIGPSFIKPLRQFSQSVIDMMTKQYKLMDETLALIKSLEDVDNPAYRTDIKKRIGDNLQLLTQRDTDNYLIINEWINSNVLDYKVKNSIKELKGYEKAAALLNPETLATWKKTYGGLITRRVNLATQINSMINPFSWFGDNIAKWKGTSNSAKRLNKWKSFFTGPEFAELRRFLVLGQTQSAKAISEYSKLFGPIPTVFMVAKEYLYGYIYYTVLMGFIDYATDYFGTFVRNVPYLNEWAPIYRQILSFDEHIKQEGQLIGVESLEGYRLFGMDFGKYLWEEATELDKRFPGILDDIGVILKNMRQVLWTKEDVDKDLEFLKNQKAQAEASRKKVVDNANKLKQKGVNAINKLENSESDFRIFIKKDWIDPNTKKTQLYGDETYTKNGDFYTVTQYDPNTGNPSLYEYKWNGTTFEENIKSN